MKIVLSLFALSAIACLQTGCSSDASAHHGEGRHGVGASAGTGQGSGTNNDNTAVGEHVDRTSGRATLRNQQRRQPGLL